MQVAAKSANNKADLLFRTTSACDACRVRKRKCDGKQPCSYCVAKNQICEFSQKKKRGPKKRRIEEIDGEDNSMAVVVDPSPKESELFDTVEAYRYLDICWNYIRIHPFSNKTKIRSPTTTAHKVQAYSTLAYAARLCGDKAQATIYSQQARVLVGSIFDSPEMDSVAALLMMCHYCLLTLDLPRSAFYAGVASNLAKIVPSGKYDVKVGAFCSLTSILTDSSLPNQQKISTLKDVSKSLQPRITAGLDKFSPMIAQMLEFHANMILVLGFNTFYPETKYASEAFNQFDGLSISEDARLRLFDCMEQIGICCQDKQATHSAFAKVIMIPSYRAVINWKSNHIQEGIDDTISCLAGLQVLDNACLFGLLSHFPQLCVLGSLVKMLLEQGQIFLAKQLGDHIKNICKIMKPDLDFICRQVDELLEKVSPITISSNPPISLSFPVSPLSFPTSHLPATMDHHVIITNIAEEEQDTCCEETIMTDAPNNDVIVTNNYVNTFSDDPAVAASVHTSPTVTSFPTADTSSAPTTTLPNDASSPGVDFTTTWFTEEGAELDVNLVDDILLSANTDDDMAHSFFGLPIVNLQG